MGLPSVFLSESSCLKKKKMQKDVSGKQDNEIEKMKNWPYKF